MNKKLTFFEETALDLLFFKHNYEDTWYNIVINTVKKQEYIAIVKKFQTFYDDSLKELLQLLDTPTSSEPYLLSLLGRLDYNQYYQKNLNINNQSSLL